MICIRYVCDYVRPYYYYYRYYYSIRTVERFVDCTKEAWIGYVLRRKRKRKSAVFWRGRKGIYGHGERLYYYLTKQMVCFEIIILRFYYTDRQKLLNV
jgi:hypothetical protein